MYLRHVNPIRKPLDEDPSLLGHTKLNQRIHAAIPLSVTKWEVTGTFSGVRSITPTPDEPPYTEVITRSVTAEVDLFPLSEGADIIGGATYWFGQGSSGGVFIDVTIGATLLQDAYLSDNPETPYCNFVVEVFAGADETTWATYIATRPLASSSLEIEVFGQTFTTEAIGQSAEGGETEPTAPAPSGVKVKAIGYAPYNGKWDTSTGGPATS